MESNSKYIEDTGNNKCNQSPKKMKFSKLDVSGKEPMHISNDNKPAKISMDCNNQLDSDDQQDDSSNIITSTQTTEPSSGSVLSRNEKCKDFYSLASDSTLKTEMNIKGLEFIDKNMGECTNTRNKFVWKPPCFQYRNNFDLDASSDWRDTFTNFFNRLIKQNHSTTSLDINEQNSIDIKSYSVTQSPNKTLNTQHQMDQQQEEICECILSQFKLDNRFGHLDIFTIFGIPGSGKTFLLQSIKDNEKNRSIYISSTNVQIDEAAKKHHIQSLTVFNMVTRMLCIEHILYETKKKFMDALSYLQNDIFSGDDVPKLIKSPNVIGDFLTTDNNESASELAEQHGNLCIFFDEMYMEPPGLISLVLYLLRLFAKHYNLHIVLLLVGDFDKTPPFFTASDDYSFLEKASVKHFYTSSQHRINSQYMEFITELKKAAQDGDCLQLIRKQFEPAIFAQDIEYSYPISKVINKHKELELVQLIKWFKSDNIATEILNLRLLTFTNDDVHYNNIALAISIFSQLQNYEQEINVAAKATNREKASNNADNSFSIDSYMKFSLLAYDRDGDIFEDHLEYNLANGDINILPLIRYFPYRLLSRSMSIPIMTLVYLIHWCNDSCIVYEPNDDILLEVKKVNFFQRQFKYLALYGFPLQMAYASTFRLSQGQTINDHNICINLSNATKKDIYAMLSRINDESFIHRIGF